MLWMRCRVVRSISICTVSFSFFLSCFNLFILFYYAGSYNQFLFSLCVCFRTVLWSYSQIAMWRWMHEITLASWQGSSLWVSGIFKLDFHGHVTWIHTFSFHSGPFHLQLMCFSFMHLFSIYYLRYYNISIFWNSYSVALKTLFFYLYFYLFIFGISLYH